MNASFMAVTPRQAWPDRAIAASRAFYEKLSVKMTNGNGHRWVVLMNGATTIGLFQGMFDRNMLTFNPGWEGLVIK